ncbi:hypothetical protein LIER_14620 [Lithospermum erythrorhizon]|uniref:Uncharacterized protein n=1 Tax=Lithospermum erythrorhizon TaxID=34254 RepID=A0AAV3Q1S2_LITER
MAIITEENEHDENDLPEINGPNSGDLHDRLWDDAPKPVNLRTGRTMPEVGNSDPLEMAWIIHEMTRTIIGNMMQKLREHIPQFRKENPRRYRPSGRKGKRPTPTLPRCGGTMRQLWGNKVVMELGRRHSGPGSSDRCYGTLATAGGGPFCNS